MLFISHTTNFLSHLFHSRFESELGINLQDLECSVHTISSDVSFLLHFFGQSLTFLSTAHILISPELKSCSLPPQAPSYFPLLFSKLLFHVSMKSMGDMPRSNSEGISLLEKWFLLWKGLENYRGLSVRHICLPNAISE